MNPFNSMLLLGLPVATALNSSGNGETQTLGDLQSRDYVSSHLLTTPTVFRHVVDLVCYATRRVKVDTSPQRLLSSRVGKMTAVRLLTEAVRCFDKGSLI